MILLTIIVFILILGVLVLVHEFGHFVMARRAGMRVEEFGFGFPPRLLGFKRGGTLYSLNLIPFGGFVKILGENGENTEADAFSSKSTLARFSVLVAGVTMNAILAWFLLSIVLAVGIPTVISQDEVLPNGATLRDSAVTILLVEPQSPAEESGMRAGDAIVAIDGVTASTMEVVLDATSHKAGQRVNYTLKRGLDLVEIKVVPRAEPPEGQGPLGVALGLVGKVSYPWYQAPFRGIAVTFNLAIQIIVAFAGLIWGLLQGHSQAGSLTGPIGIAVLTRDATQLGLVYLLQFTALLSINLAIINILPFPALDGGRVFFLLIEKLRKKRMNVKVEGYANTIGFLLLISLLVWVSTKDVVRFSDQLQSLWNKVTSII